MHFEETQRYKKGEIGEQIVDSFLLSRGIIPYKPNAGKAHPFDRLCATKDKKKLYIVECKTKARRTYYPDTGIDIRHYNDYSHIRNIYGIDVWLFFVDEYLKQVYGNLLSELEQPATIIHKEKTINYPLTNNGIIYFPLRKMKKVCDINENTIDALASLSSRSYEYPEVKDGKDIHQRY